jgi:hypothetical protein
MRLRNPSRQLALLALRTHDEMLRRCVQARYTTAKKHRNILLRQGEKQLETVEISGHEHSGRFRRKHDLNATEGEVCNSTGYVVVRPVLFADLGYRCARAWRSWEKSTLVCSFFVRVPSCENMLSGLLPSETHDIVDSESVSGGKYPELPVQGRGMLLFGLGGRGIFARHVQSHYALTGRVVEEDIFAEPSDWRQQVVRGSRKQANGLWRSYEQYCAGEQSLSKQNPQSENFSILQENSINAKGRAMMQVVFQGFAPGCSAIARYDGAGRLEADRD